MLFIGVFIYSFNTEMYANFSVITTMYVDHVSAAYPYKMLQTAETIRSLGKPSLQTLFLTAIPTKDKYVGVFVAPPDTQFEYDGKIEDVTKGLSLYFTLF